MYYSLLADLVVAVHTGFVVFVVAGLLVILLGVALSWNWVRNFWFRLAHVAAICFVALESIFNIDCPLTVWEDQLRRWSGRKVTEGTFIGRFFHEMLFWDLPTWAFTTMYIAFALLVLATFVLAPPRWPGRKKAAAPDEPVQPEDSPVAADR